MLSDALRLESKLGGPPPYDARPERKYFVQEMSSGRPINAGQCYINYDQNWDPDTYYFLKLIATIKVAYI